MLRYAITDRQLHAGTEAQKRDSLCRQAVRLAEQGVQYLQVREKDLPLAGLLDLTQGIRRALAGSAGSMRLLLNSTLEIARAARVDGVHLSSAMASAASFSASSAAPGGQTEDYEASMRWPSQEPLLVSVSCHTLSEVKRAICFADLILFAPVFRKVLPGQATLSGTGLAALREVCRAAAPTPVLALGGVTVQNADACLEAGAAGVAGIRLFI